jgi:hypothetical protein
VVALRHALLGTDHVFTTGLVLQELLQGFAGPKDRAQLVDRLSALAFLQPVKKITSKRQKSETPAAVAACKLEPLTPYSSSSVAETI